MRSKLFVPASRPELFAKALAGAADAVSFDLEDAVLPHRRAQARADLAGFLQGLVPPAGKTLVARVNPVGSDDFAADLQAVALPALDLLNLPKVDDAAQVQAAARALEAAEAANGVRRPIRLLVNIETPLALRCAHELARSHWRVAGLQLGLADLFEPLGIDRREPAAVRHAMLAVRLAAGEAGLWACDSAFVDIGDPAGFAAEAALARRLGFAGKSCIHPSQVPLANEAFGPTPGEIARAERVLAAAAQAQAQGQGAFQVDGQMADGPFVARARFVLSQAARRGLASAPQTCQPPGETP